MYFILVYVRVYNLCVLTQLYNASLKVFRFSIDLK